MFSRVFAGFSVFCLCICCSACHSTHQLSRDEIILGEDYDVLEVNTTIGEHFVMKQLSGGGRGFVKDSTIVGVAEDGKLIKIPLSQVNSIQISRPDSGKTSLFIIVGVPIGLFALAGLLVALNGGILQR